MKMFIAIALLATSFASQAAQIASCSSVEHHGHYVEIKDDNKKITVLLSNDGEVVEESVKVASITKNGMALKDAPAASWAIRQGIKGSAEVDQSGVIAIKGSIKKDSVLININTYSGQNFLVRGDYVEQLNCTKAE
ncbi:MAG: hypothetical protein V4598_12040 [Bdellovibrionota bacterium]